MKLALNGEIYEIGGESPSYTAGDGVSIESSVIALQNPMHGIYTQAEFNALSEEEKKSGTYIVDDGNNGGGSSSSNIYSTEETRVGTWLDGKPLYRKTIIAQIISNPVNPYTVSSIPNAHYVNFYGHISDPAHDNSIFPVNASLSAVATSCTWGSSDGTIYGAYGTQFAGSQIFITVEYTKTTDTAPSEASSASLSTNVLTDVVDSITPSIMSTTMGISDAEEVSE